MTPEDKLKLSRAIPTNMELLKHMPLFNNSKMMELLAAHDYNKISDLVLIAMMIATTYVLMDANADWEQYLRVPDDNEEHHCETCDKEDCDNRDTPQTMDTLPENKTIQ